MRGEEHRSPISSDRAAYFRGYAEQLRLDAEGARLVDHRERLLRLADDFDQLADSIVPDRPD